MIRIGICDDNQLEMRRLERWIAQYAAEHDLLCQCTTFDSGEDILIHYGEQFDILFLDIEMAGINGVDTAKRIRKMDDNVIILFYTRYEDFALAGYRVDAVSYLLKSEKYSSFAKEFKKALKMCSNRCRKIGIRMGATTRFLQIGCILYADYYKHKITYHLLDGTTIAARGQLKELLVQDMDGMLLLIHKNSVVNKVWIEACEKQSVRLRGVERIFEVSRPKWKIVEREYLEFCQRKLL